MSKKSIHTSNEIGDMLDDAFPVAILLKAPELGRQSLHAELMKLVPESVSTALGAYEDDDHILFFEEHISGIGFHQAVGRLRKRFGSENLKQCLVVQIAQEMFDIGSHVEGVDKSFTFKSARRVECEESDSKGEKLKEALKGLVDVLKD